MNDIIIDTQFADQKGEVMVVKLSGFIDQSNSFTLQRTFDDILNSGCFKVIIDFSHVLYISSAGWGIFVGEIKRFRDEGGDIKLVNMTPDIYEVYQMLEFYHIFEDYNSLESALQSFNGTLIEKELPSTEVEDDHEINIEMDNPVIESGDDEISDKEVKVEHDKDDTENDNVVVYPISNEAVQDQRSADDEIMYLAKLPINEKIRKIISQYPQLNAWEMKKVLKDDRFGNTKINIFKLYKVLKELDLNTKKKRYRFYRSS